MSIKENVVTSELLLKRENFKSSVMLWLIALFFVLAGLWASFAEIDELVRGEGKVIPSSHLKVVQSLDGGVLSGLFIEEGSQVKAGQLLMQLDDTRAKSKFNERRQGIQNLQVKIQRLRAEAEGDVEPQFSPEVMESVPEIVFEQKALFEQRLRNLASASSVIESQIGQQQQQLIKKNAELEQLRQEYALAKKEFNILKPLYSEGIVSQVELIQAEKSMLAAKRVVLDVELQIPQVKSSIEELESKQRQLGISFKTDAQIELSEAMADLARISQMHKSLEVDVERASIKSPVNGIVKQVMLTTMGGVVKPGMDLVSIVPEEDALIIETKVRPSDIARLYPGQKAMVKFSAYDFTVYGGLEAELVHISADSLTNEQGESFYLVRVRTHSNFLGKEKGVLPIIPGMLAQVDILTGKKTLLSYLLKPILRAKQVALTEQ